MSGRIEESKAVLVCVVQLEENQEQNNDKNKCEKANADVHT